MASDVDLVEWAKEHGPDYLRYAAERGHTIKAGVMDTIATMVAEALGGRVVRPGDELIDWKPRAEPSAENNTHRLRICDTFLDWLVVRQMPRLVQHVVSEVVRVEEQADPTNPKQLLKYSGVVVTLKHPATAERFVVVNLEAGAS